MVLFKYHIVTKLVLLLIVSSALSIHLGTQKEKKEIKTEKKINLNDLINKYSFTKYYFVKHKTTNNFKIGLKKYLF